MTKATFCDRCGKQIVASISEGPFFVLTEHLVPCNETPQERWELKWQRDYCIECWRELDALLTKWYQAIGHLSFFTYSSEVLRSNRLKFAGV